MPVFSQVSWQGGIANDEYLADSTQFSDCEDVNIYESSGYFKLGPAKTSTNLTDGQNYYCFVNTKTATGTPITFIGGTYGAGTEGIYADASTPGSYTTTAGGKGAITATGIVLQAEGSNTGTGFIITTFGGLYTWSFDAVVGFGNFSDVGLTNRKANGAIATKYTPYLLIGPRLVYAYKNEVRVFNVSTWVEEYVAGSAVPLLDIGQGYEIIYLKQNGTQIEIYANKGGNAKKIYWDTVSDTTSEQVIFPGKTIINIANFGNYDIVLYSSSNQYHLGTVEGYDFKPLYSSDYPYSTLKRGFQTLLSAGTGAISTSDNITGFPKDNSNIYSLGTFKPGKPMSLSRTSITSVGTTVGLVYGDGYTVNVYGNTNSTTGKAVTMSASTYDSDGFIITNPIKGTSYAIRKTCKKVMYGYELKTGSTIKIYYQLNKDSDEQSSGNWTLADTITVSTDFPVGAGYRSFNLNGTFNQIRFKVQIETSNSSYSPKVFDFHFEYDETSQEL